MIFFAFAPVFYGDCSSIKGRISRLCACRRRLCVRFRARLNMLKRKIDQRERERKSERACDDDTQHTRNWMEIHMLLV